VVSKVRLALVPSVVMAPLDNTMGWRAMRIYGISQSSGVERRLHIEKGTEGVVLIISDHEGNVERARITVQPDSLMGAFMDRALGSVTIEGRSPSNEAKKLLDMEVRGNEVLLTVRAEAAAGSDVAVGLDDFQDALEKVIG
jgi:hypothetical protein